MLDLRVLVAACVASIAILVLGLGLLVSFKAAHEPAEGLVQNVRIRERPRMDAGGPDAASLPAVVPVQTPAPKPALVPTPAPKPVILPVATPAHEPVIEPAVMPTPVTLPAPPVTPASPPAETTSPPATEIVTTGAIPEPPAAAAPEAVSPALQVPRAVAAPHAAKRKTIAIVAKQKNLRPKTRRRVRIREQPSDPISALISGFQR